MDETPEVDDAQTLTVYQMTGEGGDDDEGSETDLLTYEPGEEFVIQRGVTAWVDATVVVFNESPGDTFMEDEEAGVLARGRYRWTGTSLLYLGRQKGPIRPPG